MNQSHLSVAELAELKAKLLAMLSDAEAGLAAQKKSEAEADHVSEVASQEDNEAVHRDEERQWDALRNTYSAKEVSRIREELERMEAGDYGICAQCGCGIPFARLQIEPQTQHCVACKSEWEKKVGIA